MNEEAEIRITRARIMLQKQHPFFAFLSLSLIPTEVNDARRWEDGGMGMAVDPYGHLYYSPSFVNGLTNEEMRGVLTHEIMHHVYMHLTRGKDWNRLVGNIAMDITVNEVLKDNGFTLPKGGIWSNEKREVKVMGIKVERCNEKTTEEIYRELMAKLKDKVKDLLKKRKLKKGKGEGIPIDLDDLGDYEVEGSTIDGEGKVRNFDKHIQTKGGKKISKEEAQKIEKGWLDKVHEAYAGSKLAGNEPAGIGRIIGKLHESRVNWKQLLLRYIQSSIPSDYDYSRPNKKSISSGFYMPDTTKERVEISVGIDVSGSIGQDELTDFLSEIVGIARAYREQVKMTLFTHETDIVDEWTIENGSVAKILAMRIKGGGGTSFERPYKTFIKKHPDTKLLVWLTDGFGDEIPKKDLRSDIIWCLCSNSSDKIVKKMGRVIKIGK
jgi:predicted metal-dependent peptidase